MGLESEKIKNRCDIPPKYGRRARFWAGAKASLPASAGIGLATLQRIEQNEGVVKGNFSTVLKIQRAFEKAGILFTDDEAGEIGVRLKTDKR